MSERIGNNAAAMLRDAINTLVDWEERRLEIKADRKEHVDVLKHRLGVPAAALLKLAKADADKEREKAEQLAQAGAILGVEVYAEKVTPEEPEWSNEVVKEVKGHLQYILSLEEQDADIKKQINDRKKSLKKDGYSVPTIETIVRFRMDPDAEKAHQERNIILNTYLDAIG